MTTIQRLFKALSVLHANLSTPDDPAIQHSHALLRGLLDQERDKLVEKRLRRNVKKHRHAVLRRLINPAKVSSDVAKSSPEPTREEVATQRKAVLQRLLDLQGDN